MPSTYKSIGIIGAGAVGSVVGGSLSHAGHNVTLVDQWPEHIETIKKNGLVVETRSDRFVSHPTALHIHELQSLSHPFDAIFIAVKSYDTEWATTLSLRYLHSDHGIIVDFQNGINDGRVAEIAGENIALGCVITIGAGLYEPGVALRTDTNALAFKIGEQNGSDTARCRELVQIMQSVGETEFTDDLWGERWSKLMVNCMTNALSGISGYGTADVRVMTEPRRVGIQLGAEVVRVAKAYGHKLHPVLGLSPEAIVGAAEGKNIEEVESVLMESARNAGSAGRPSMGQDVLKGRRTEIDFLNGYVSKMGREKNVPTPFNDHIVSIIHALGIGFKSSPSNLKCLVDLLP